MFVSHGLNLINGSKPIHVQAGKQIMYIYAVVRWGRSSQGFHFKKPKTKPNFLNPSSNFQTEPNPVINENRKNPIVKFRLVGSFDFYTPLSETYISFLI